MYRFMRVKTRLRILFQNEAVLNEKEASSQFERAAQ